MHYLMKRLSLLFLTLLSATFLAAQTDATVFSLRDAVEYASANNVAVRNARVDILDAEQNVKENLSRGLPQFNGSLDHQHFLKVPVVPLPAAFAMGDPNAPSEISFQLKNNFTAGLSARAMVFDGSFFVGLRAARASEDYFNLELENAQRRVRSQVTQSYFPVLLLKTNLAVLDNNISNLEKLQNETQAQYDAGFVEQLDVDRLTLSLRNLRTQRRNLEQQAENALRALKYVLNYPLDQPLSVEDDLDALELDVEVTALEGDIAFTDRPEIRLLDKTLDLQDLNVELQKSAYLPTAYASLSGQYQFQGDRLRTGEEPGDGFWAPTVVAGLSVSIPIYDFGGRSARVERAKLAKIKIQNQREDLQRGIQLEVLNARGTFRTAATQLSEQRENLELAERIYETTQIKYREGVGSSIETVQAEQQLYESQANFLNALYEALVAREELLLALGR